MADLSRIYQRAADGFARRLDLVTDTQGSLPTPCTEWSVRDLVAHVLDEQLWIPPLVDGLTIAEVGDRFAGDQIGADAVGAWSAAQAEVVSVLDVSGVGQRIVSLSYGESTADAYVTQVSADTLVHTWDLARALDADEQLDAGDALWAIDVLSPMLDSARAAGVFGPALEVSADADALTRLLALTGRARCPSGAEDVAELR
jgi:uncharacterized protein (TIGR03086 family)